MAKEENWDIVIKPKDKLLSLDLGELWKYRELCMLFVKRNIYTSYKQTVLGPLWFIIQPCMTVIMYMVVFGGIAGIPTDGVPQPLFYLAGVCMWQYFSTCLSSSSNTFLSNAGIFSKVYFPRLISPISDLISNLLKFGIQFLLFVAVYIVYVLKGINVAPNWYALLFPVLVFMMAAMALGFGILISSMTTKYHDLSILFGFFMQLWMYATPIVYPLSQVGDKAYFGIKLATIMRLNPITPVIETFKYGFLSAGEFIGWGWMAYSFGFTALLLFFGALVFNKVQKSFLDTV